MDTPHPSFAIVVPTYQRRDVVADALRAIAKIEYPGDVEVVVVVDGSTDGTADALSAIPCQFPLRVIEQDNQGAAAARNRGAAESGGEIILFLDDDMMCRPDILAAHARSYAAGADAVLGDILLDPASPGGLLAEFVGAWSERRSRDLRGGAPLGLWDMLSGQLSVRRAVFDQLGGFDGQFTHGGSYGNEDLDLGARLLERHSVHFQPDAVSWQRYIVTPDQHLRQWHAAGRADVAFMRKHPARASELQKLHALSSPMTRSAIRWIASVPVLTKAILALASRLVATSDAAEGRGRRWASKLFLFARSIAYWSGVRSAGGLPTSSRAIILCYHAISDLSGDPVLSEYGIPPDRFAAQLDRLATRGFAFVSPAEFQAFLNGEAGLPKRAALLTFDDCYAELGDVARDILRPRRIPAFAFAVARYQGASNAWDIPLGAGERHLLGADGLARLPADGVEVGCHSGTHRDLTRLAPEDLTRETATARDELAALGVPRPRAFAYPYGLHDSASRQAVEAAGYSFAFGLETRPVARTSSRFALPRIEILARDRGWRFWLKTSFPTAARLLVP